MSLTYLFSLIAIMENLIPCPTCATCPSESNSFQLLCLISLLPLLPDNERVNFVVLGEPTSHMCPVSRSIFNERFLPVLKGCQIVPSVFVISPHSDDICPNSKQEPSAQARRRFKPDRIRKCYEKLYPSLTTRLRMLSSFYCANTFNASEDPVPP